MNANNDDSKSFAVKRQMVINYTTGISLERKATLHRELTPSLPRCKIDKGEGLMKQVTWYGWV